MTPGVTSHVQPYWSEPHYHRLNTKIYCFSIILLSWNLFLKVLFTDIFILTMQLSILVIRLLPNTLLQQNCGSIDACCFGSILDLVPKRLSRPPYFTFWGIALLLKHICLPLLNLPSVLFTLDLFVGVGLVAHALASTCRDWFSFSQELSLGRIIRQVVMSSFLLL